MGHWHQLAWLYLEKSRHQLRLTPCWDELALASRPALSWQWQALRSAKQHIWRRAGPDFCQALSGKWAVTYNTRSRSGKAAGFNISHSLTGREKILLSSIHYLERQQALISAILCLGGSRHFYHPFVISGKAAGIDISHSTVFLGREQAHCYQLGSVLWRSATRACLDISQ